MIIGTITLITILFLGGTTNTFVFENLDKHIKKAVIEKERKDEILSDLKVGKRKSRPIMKRGRD